MLNFNNRQHLIDTIKTIRLVNGFHARQTKKKKLWTNRYVINSFKVATELEFTASGCDLLKWVTKKNDVT